MITCTKHAHRGSNISRLSDHHDEIDESDDLEAEIASNKLFERDHGRCDFFSTDKDKILNIFILDKTEGNILPE